MTKAIRRHERVLCPGELLMKSSVFAYHPSTHSTRQKVKGESHDKFKQKGDANH